MFLLFTTNIFAQKENIRQLFAERPTLQIKYFIDLSETSKRCAALYTAYASLTGTDTPERTTISTELLKKGTPYMEFVAFISEMAMPTTFYKHTEETFELVNWYIKLITSEYDGKENIIKGEKDTCDLIAATISPLIKVWKQ